MAWDDGGVIRDVFEGGVGVIRDMFERGVGVIRDMFERGVGVIRDVFEGGVGVIRDMFERDVGVIRDVFERGVCVIRYTRDRYPGLVNGPPSAALFGRLRHVTHGTLFRRMGFGFCHRHAALDHRYHRDVRWNSNVYVGGGFIQSGPISPPC